MTRMKHITWMVLALLALAGGAAHAQLTASGTLNARLINRSGIWLAFNSDPSGVVLGNGGTSAATLNFGNVRMYGNPPAGVSQTRTANNFTVGTPFDVYVEIGGTASASYRLQASLQTAPGVYAFKVDAVALSTAAATIVAADPHYGANVAHTLYLTIPTAAPAGTVSNTVNFTVVAN